MTDFARAFPLVIKHEGGYVDHPRDPGGATNLGVTIGTLSGWLGRPATKAEVRALTIDAVAPIYRKNYWDAVKADDLPAGVNYCVFDFGVNSGPRRAIMALQRAVGVADDGAIGPITLAAVKRKSPEDIISRICSDRLSFMRRLSTWPTFGRGWQRRVEGVEREAIRMAMDAASHTVTAPAPVITRTYPPLTVEPAPAAPVSGWAALFKAIAKLFGGKS
jgi:lysozyme family protein